MHAILQFKKKNIAILNIKKYHFKNSNYLYLGKKLLIFSENTWDTNDKDRFPLFGRGTAANSPLMTKWTLIVIVLITTTLITIH